MIDLDGRMRPFDTGADLGRVLRFVGRGNALDDNCGWLHPGDICHNLTRVGRYGDAGEFLHLYEEEGEVVALVMTYSPHMARFQVLIEPGRRGGELERALVGWGAARVRTLSGAVEPIKIYVMDCDRARDEALRARGFSKPERPSVGYTTRLLAESIPASDLPEGFTIRKTWGPEESEALGEVHSGAFNSDWSNNSYRAVMEHPAFGYGRELVVVAPDGRLAAFLIYWLDPVSGGGLFEPVGCHPDFQRLGLTRALMYEGMRRMQTGGMSYAVVKHALENDASSKLYAAVGFRRKYTTYDWSCEL